MQSKKLLNELTPEAFMCGGGIGCASVFEKEDGTLVIIGKIVPSELREHLPEGRVGPGETAIEIPRGLVAGLKS